MEIIAKARNLRMSPRKVRLIADLVRGLDVQGARAQLRFFRKDAARPVLKLLESAIANAEHNFKLHGTGLYIKKITVDQAAKLKRWRPRAFGRAAPIKKHGSHITIILDERKTEGAPQKELKAAVVKKVTKKTEKSNS